jgi:predicted flap endonuclease-1-like 5' DNA nuclease
MLLNPFAGREKSRSWFWWGINLGILLALLVWWWLKNKPNEQAEFEVKAKPLVLPDDEPEETPSQEQAPAPSKPVEPDDLEVIEGLGPRSAQVLGQAGIATYAQLAAMEPGAIHEVLRTAGVRIAFPGTWPEQAGLAAAGNWDVLKELQSSLQGGRRS